MTATAGLVLILVVVLIGHLVEEVRTGFRQKYPLGEMPLPFFVLVNVLLYTFCATTFVLVSAGHATGKVLAWILAILWLPTVLGILA